MKRILIIDDAATVRMYHRSILEDEGHFIEEAINGIEALEKALLDPFDLYVVDLNMSKLDGYSFLKELRGRDLPQAPAVMVSSEAKPQDRRRAYEAGANLYLVKPVKPEEMLSLCRLLLGEVRP